MIDKLEARSRFVVCSCMASRMLSEAIVDGLVLCRIVLSGSVAGLSCQVMFGSLLNEQCIYFAGELGEIGVFEF